MDYSVFVVVGTLVALIISVMFLVLLWSTLEAAREFYQRENQKHRPGK